MEINELIALFSETSERAPAYQRIKDLIKTQIETGNLHPGTQIPSENEFVDALGISRMTINRAMRELTADGLLVRTRGIGTFIAEPKAHGALMEVRNIADEIQQRGNTHSTQVLVHEEVFADERGTGWGPGQIPAGVGTRAFHTVILHLENQVPFQIEERFVVPSAAPDYLKQDFTKSVPSQHLFDVAPLTNGKHVVEAVLATVEQCELLQIEATEPCLRIERYTYSNSGLVQVARLLHPGFRIRLEGQF